jgi:D-alanyl-D-alanine carboxypeptidase
LDIVIRKDGVLIYENEDMIAEPEIFAKIHSKLADYGFILRYLP